MKRTIKEKFKHGELTKPEFIEGMYAEHARLFEYAELLKEVDLSEITIKPEGVYFTSKQDGIKLFCPHNDQRTAPFEIMNFDSYESEDADLLFGVIRNGDIIFDIGANIGWYTISMARRFPDSVIHSFEPLPATFQLLQQNVQLNPFTNIRLNEFGLSDATKTLQFYTSPLTSVSNSAENISGAPEVTITECKVTPMDEYTRNHPVKVDVIKCDVEGAELFTFRGAMETIRRDRPVIFTEMLRKWAARFNYHPNEIIQLLAEAGYQCFVNNGQNRLERIEAVTETTRQTNYFFLHPDAHPYIYDQYVS